MQICIFGKANLRAARTQNHRMFFSRIPELCNLDSLKSAHFPKWTVPAPNKPPTQCLPSPTTFNLERCAGSISHDLHIIPCCLFWVSNLTESPYKSRTSNFFCSLFLSLSQERTPSSEPNSVTFDQFLRFLIFQNSSTHIGVHIKIYAFRPFQ